MTIDLRTPDFRSPAMLTAHIADTMKFYHPHCIDPSGGFYQFFMDDGAIYDRTTRHLVSSTYYLGEGFSADTMAVLMYPMFRLIRSLGFVSAFSNVALLRFISNDNRGVVVRIG